MSDFLQELLEARGGGRPCALATVAATTGSIPRHPGAKMLVYADGFTNEQLSSVYAPLASTSAPTPPPESPSAFSPKFSWSSAKNPAAR